METFNKLLLEHPEILYGGAGATAFIVGGAVIYKITTRQKPTHANVNCWFCDRNTVVPYGNRNCWDCPNCDQYNGFQENGDYNKPIPAQYMEHLNHGVSGTPPLSESPKSLQWVNCQMLLCRKCNNNQSAKIKQLASYNPRDDKHYNEEIEVYKHHLEQTYKLCRPCQTAVEFYIKYQNRQLRTALLNHQLRRTRESETGFVKSSHSVSSPFGVILLRLLSFLICAIVLSTLLIKLSEDSISSSGPTTLSGGIVPPKPEHQDESADNNSTSRGMSLWKNLLQLLPSEAVENIKLLCRCGKENQLALVSVGLSTCLTAIFLAGPSRLRRIDALASVMWFAVLCLYLVESYWSDALGWMENANVVTTSLCCLVNFAAAAGVRRSLGPRRGRYRRYLSGSAAVHPFSSQPIFHTPNPTDSFIPTPPPNLSQLISRHRGSGDSKASPSSLPGRLNRALCLGTIPSITRTDSGYLFSGSRPASLYKESACSDYFSLKSGSRPSSPGPSPTPSVAESFTSSSGSARQRRPLISPARLNISGQKLRLFSTEQHQPVTPPLSPFPFHTESSPSVYSGCFSHEASPQQNQNDLSSFFRDDSIIEEEKRSRSSGSSACQVGTTTLSPENVPAAKGFLKCYVWPGILLASLTSNLLVAGFYVYHNWR